METQLKVEKSFTVAFKANNGKYITEDSDHTLRALSDQVDRAEHFQVIPLDGKVIVLMSATGKYIVDRNDAGGPLEATASSIEGAIRMEVQDWDEHKCALLTSKGTYVQLVENLEVLECLSSEISNWATFEIVQLSGNGTLEEEEVMEIIPPIRKLGAQLGAPTGKVYTVCFSGTACTRDEGEVSRKQSDRSIYSKKTGYLPVRIHKEISGELSAISPSVVIRGVGENDWAIPRDQSEPLTLSGPLRAPSALLSYVKKYSGGNQYSKLTQVNGWSAPALALHAANLAAASGMQQYNFIGHSRGAVECIMAAWFLYAYGPAQVKHIPVNILAIDPVPGTGEWYGLLTQLPPNVVNYVGIYAWDMGVQPMDRPYSALVPRPNGRMTGRSNEVKLKDSWWPFDKWKYIADDAQLEPDPLKPSAFDQPKGYELYACRGRHSTVSGNKTADGNYVPNFVNDDVQPVPELIYKMVRGYLSQWGTSFLGKSAVDETVLSLRKRIHTEHREFDAMGGGATRTSSLAFRPFVRRLSSIHGSLTFDTVYMDDAVGDPPYTLVYPVTTERRNAGWVKWKFL